VLSCSKDTAKYLNIWFGKDTTERKRLLSKN